MSTNYEVDVKVKFLSNLCTPENFHYATPYSAGIDLRACIDQDQIVLAPGQRYAFPTGVAIEITKRGIAAFVFSRSGLGTKEGLVVSQGVGVIDPDYRGEIIVSLLNTSKELKIVSRGQRIAQLVFMPVYTANIIPVSNLTPTQRGAGGFGHTGKI